MEGEKSKKVSEETKVVRGRNWTVALMAFFGKAFFIVVTVASFVSEC